MGAEFLGYHWPAHELGDGKELEELGIKGELYIAGIELDAVEEVGLLIVVGSEDDEVDYAL